MYEFVIQDIEQVFGNALKKLAEQPSIKVLTWMVIMIGII